MVQEVKHSGAQLVAIGGEEAWQVARASAVVLFGRGPANGPVDAERRMAEAVTHLAPAVTAARWARQVHGRVIASVAAEPSRPLVGAYCVGRCDGLVTADPGMALAVWTADCVPLLLDGGEAVAAVHAGWRGLARGVVARAVRRLELEFGVRPAGQQAFLGPAVAPCHYPVGPEVVAALAELGEPTERWLIGGDRVDLRRLIAACLHRLGVPVVEFVAGCTCCDGRLASFRRDGDRAGRQWSLIARRAG